MSRKELLELLQRRCAELGVDLRFSTLAPDVEELSRDYDLVLAADGLNSAVRSRYAEVFRPSLDVRKSKYMWLGTDLVFEAFKFFVKDTEHGVMQIHGYPYSDEGSTFIVEMHEDVWRSAGFDATEHQAFRPGESDEAAVDAIRAIFAEELEGHEVLVNNSKWINFTTVRNESWRHGNIVLLGDAAHTAHFSIGSGTKLAMEDSLALAACLHEHAELEAALEAYETERRPVVESTQRAAQASLEWFENIGMYKDQNPVQFCFNLLTRSRRITYDNLKLRDPEFAARVDEEFARTQGIAGSAPAMFQPYRIGGLELKNRIVVSPMDMYSATDGVPGNFHLVHLGSKALGGAGLVMTEMVCVSETGRITPGCSGLYNEAQQESWREIVDFVHTARRRPSASSWATPAARAPPSSCGKASTSRCPRAAGSRWAPRPSPTARAARPRAKSAAPKWTRSGTSSSPPPSARPLRASTCWSCTARTATCSPPSSRRWPTAAATSTADRWRTGCATRWRCSTPSAPPGRRTSR